MAEERKFCRICKNLGIDCEAGTFYCSLSHRPDKLPSTLKCDEFILCDLIARLEQLKNKYYQQTLDDEITISDLITKCNDLEQENRELKEALEEIRNLVQGHKVADEVRLKSIMHYIDEVLE